MIRRTERRESKISDLDLTLFFGHQYDFFQAVLNPIKPDGVSQRHTLHLIASHFYMNEENEVSFHEFLS